MAYERYDNSAAMGKHSSLGRKNQICLMVGEWLVEHDPALFVSPLSLIENQNTRVLLVMNSSTLAQKLMRLHDLEGRSTRHQMRVGMLIPCHSPDGRLTPLRSIRGSKRFVQNIDKRCVTSDEDGLICEFAPHNDIETHKCLAGAGSAR